jgi:hypothetical protein
LLAGIIPAIGAWSQEIAQAQAEGLTLVTPGSEIARYAVTVLW